MFSNKVYFLYWYKYNYYVLSLTADPVNSDNSTAAVIANVSCARYSSLYGEAVNVLDDIGICRKKGKANVD